MKLKADHAFGKEDLAKWKESIIEQVKKITVKLDF